VCIGQNRKPEERNGKQKEQEVRNGKSQAGRNKESHNTRREAVYQLPPPSK